MLLSKLYLFAKLISLSQSANVVPGTSGLAYFIDQWIDKLIF
jgi:hypothetical protein